MTVLHNQTNSNNEEVNPLREIQLSFIGVGVMAEAMIAGLLRKALVKPSQIAGSHPSPGRRDELQQKYGINVFESNREAATFNRSSEGKDGESHVDSIVILSIKPQRLGIILGELRGALKTEDLVLSIVAGAKIETIAAGLSHSSIVRAMPNTPAQIGQGMTVWTGTPELSDSRRLEVRAMLGALGRELYVETERMIDMATALSATGPTYIFMMMESLVDAGVHMGFSRHVSQELVLQTMLGSVLFAIESSKHPAELRNMVTSPGGTSAEAIYQMEKGSIRTVLSKAVYAAYQRAVALGQKK